MQLQTMACGVVTSPSQVLSNSVIQWRLVEIEFEQCATIIGTVNLIMYECSYLCMFVCTYVCSEQTRFEQALHL